MLPTPSGNPDPSGATVPRLPLSWRIAAGILLAIAVFSVLYVARGLLLPITVAFVFAFLLRPVVRFFGSLGVPDVFGAAIVMVLLVGLLSSALVLLYEPAMQWAERAPEAWVRVQERLQGVIDTVRRVTDETTPGEAPPAGVGGLPFVGDNLHAAILDRTWRFFGGLVTMTFLLYFLMASGDLFLRKLIRVLPELREKKMAVDIARHIERDVSQYLFTVTIINSVLGTVVGTVMLAMGMPNPLLWGVMAGVLNFIPYLGPMVTLTILAAVALMSFEQVGDALLRPAVFLVLTTLEGQLLTPFILGRRLTLNPVVIFISLIFWGWLWGIIGALLAVPLTMVAKILCDAVPPLRPVAEFMTR